MVTKGEEGGGMGATGVGNQGVYCHDEIKRGLIGSEQRPKEVLPSKLYEL